MINTIKKTERGQALYLIVTGIIVLLGFTSLAIDGGKIYLDRRRAQNAADQAALSAALVKIQGGDFMTAGFDRAADNGFTNDGLTNWVTINNPPASGPYAGDNDYIQVFIRVDTETALVQFFYSGPTEVTVEAVALAEGTFTSTSVLIGNAVVSLGDCSGALDHNLEFTGGGNSGGIVTKNGGVFVNSAESGSGSNCCALDPPNNGYGIVIDGPITSVGSCDYSGESMISPNPIDTGYNGGVPIDDPLAGVPEPTCTSNGYKVGNTYYPGNWWGSDMNGTVNLEPGIYCISGEIKMSGSEAMSGEGVLLYFTTSGYMSYTGNSSLVISAPTNANCLGTAPSTSASCTYVGMVIFMARNNTHTLGTGGNGYNLLKGTVYGLNGTIQAHGGGTTPDESDVIGQIIAKKVLGNGNGSFTVEYNDDWVFPPPPDPPTLQLTK
jgi:hypothetical protein